MEDNNVQGTETTAAEQEKTFTQKDVDDMISKRLDRERKKMPGEDELSAFRTWKDSQQTEQEKWNKLTGERDSAAQQLTAVQSELEQIRRERYVLSKGIKAEDADYYAYKAGKMVTDEMDFEKAVDELLKDKQSGMTVNFTAPVGGGQRNLSDKDKMNALLRSARK